MRKVFVYLIIFMLLGGTVASWRWSETAQERESRLLAETRAAVQRLEREVRVRAATGRVPVNGRGWAETIDPAWFGDNPPVNPLVPANRPWVEVASDDEHYLTDPQIRQAVDRRTPAFWYNPATGRVRARIGPTVSDRKAIELYNSVNTTAVSVLFDTTPPPEVLAGFTSEYSRLLNQPSRDGPKIIVRLNQSPAGGASVRAPVEPPLPVHASPEREPSAGPANPAESGLIGPPQPAEGKGDTSPAPGSVADAERADQD